MISIGYPSVATSDVTSGDRGRVSSLYLTLADTIGLVPDLLPKRGRSGYAQLVVEQDSLSDSSTLYNIDYTAIYMPVNYVMLQINYIPLCQYKHMYSVKG